MLHLISAAIGTYAGYFVRTNTLAALYAWTIGAAYTALGVFGWFVDGLFLGTPIAIPLGPVDNIFHLLLGTAAIAVVLLDRRSSSHDR